MGCVQFHHLSLSIKTKKLQCKKYVTRQKTPKKQNKLEKYHLKNIPNCTGRWGAFNSITCHF